LELVRMAKALHVDATILLQPEEETTVPRVLWRRGSSPLNRAREAQLLERARRYAQLEEWCNELPARSLPDLRVDPATTSSHDIENFAEDVARALELGPVPARTLEKTLEEDFGVKIFYESLEKESDADCSAACVRSDFGAAILIDASEKPWRRVFSLAHEVFHLVTWTAVNAAWGPASAAKIEEPQWYDKLERLADEFAANLLMPGSALRIRFDAKMQRRPDGKIEAFDIAQLASEFGVSTQALVIRLQRLGRLSSQQRSALLKDETLRTAFRQMQPHAVDRPIPFPVRFRELARCAFLRGEIGKATVARFLETNVATLSDLRLLSPHAESATAHS
jgi:Zn-dependent peptidase ImmA (M78 family)